MLRTVWAVLLLLLSCLLVPSTTTTTSQSLDCDFDNNDKFCGWRPSTETARTAAFKWMGITSNDMVVIPTRMQPFVPFGAFFVYVLGTYNGEVREATLTGAASSFKGHDIRIVFSYQLFSESVASAVRLVGMGHHSGTMEIFEAYATVGDDWKHARVVVPASVNTFDRLEFRVSLRIGMFAMKDVRVGLYQPNTTTTEESTVCNFELNDCNMKSEATPSGGGRIKWARYAGAEWNIADHTGNLRTGHVYGVSLNDGQTAHTNVVYRADTFAVPYSSFCLTFAYNIADNLPAGTVFAYQVLNDLSKAPGTWGGNFADQNGYRQVFGEHTDKRWFLHMHQVITKAAPVYIQFSVSVPAPAGKYAFVAIDDLVVERRLCASLKEACNFELGTTCLMQPVLRGRNTLSFARKMALLRIEVGGRLAREYLNDNVDTTWHVVQALRAQTFAGKDHTLGTVFGNYLLLTGNEDRGAADRAIMITQEYSFDHSHPYVCLSIWIYKPSEKSVLEVYQSETGDGGDGTKLFQFEGATNAQWREVILKATPKNPKVQNIYFYFVGTLNEPNAFIGLDDINRLESCAHPDNVPVVDRNSTSVRPTQTSAPPTTKGPAKKFRCDDGRQWIPMDKVCDWHHDCTLGGDEFNCLVVTFDDHDMKGYTTQMTKGMAMNFSDQITLPSVFKRLGLGAGYFIGEGVAAQGQLISPIIHQASYTCSIKFELMANSSEVTPHWNRWNNVLSNSRLEVHVNHLDTQTTSRRWQSNAVPMAVAEWKKIELKLGRITGRFQLIFSMQARTNEPTYWALNSIFDDDCEIDLSEETHCSVSAFRCRNNRCIRKAYTCDLDDDCGDGSDEIDCPRESRASFELGMNGGWGQTMKTYWSVISGRYFDGDMRRGPAVDRTLGMMDGHFLYASSLFNANRVAVIDSPAFVPKAGCIIKMHYMKNTATSTLLLIAKVLATDEEIVLREISASTDLSWIPVLYGNTFDRWIDKPIKLLVKADFKAHQDTGLPIDYIALDDISFRGQCQILRPEDVPTLSPHITTPGPDRNCSSVFCKATKTGHEICLQPEQICDFNHDCANGEDEKDCGECNFDHGEACGWKIDASSLPPNANAKLKVVQPAANSPGHEPKVDGNGNHSGGYLTVTADFGHTNGKTLNLLSPLISRVPTETCVFSLDVFRLRSSWGVINLVHPDGSRRVIRSFVVYAINKFFAVNFRMPKTDQSQRIQIDLATIGYEGDWNLFALDNFRWWNCSDDGGHHHPSTPDHATAASLTCDFEQSLCDWMALALAPGQTTSWYRNQLQTIEPGQDHTSIVRATSAPWGTWLAQQSHHSLVGEREVNVLVNRWPLLPTTKAMCLRFWYYFYDFKVNELSVSVTSSASGRVLTTLWRRTVPDRRNWTPASVQIPAQSTKFYIRFTANVWASSILGLDDISLAEGACPTSSDNNFCDFEGGNMCGWVKDNVHDSWSLKQADPDRRDHTTDTALGHYIIQDNLEQKQSTVRKSVEKFYIPFNPNDGDKDFCLQFYYYVYGDDHFKAKGDRTEVGAYTTFTKDYTRIRLSEVYNYNLSNQWNYFAANFKGTYMDSIALTAVVGDNTRVQIDDVRVLPKWCPVAGSCDFEANTCGWRNEASAGANDTLILWIRLQPSHTWMRGINQLFLNRDHTTFLARGNYMFVPIELQQLGQAVLMSPIMNFTHAGGQVSLQLWYFVRCQGQPTHAALHVSLIDLAKDGDNVVARIEVPCLGQLGWHRFEHSFGNVPGYYAFKITTNYERYIISDIGIDDIRIEEHAQGSTTPPPTTPIPRNVSELTCTFESSQPCGWAWNTSDWRKVDYASAGEFYAPRRDHTLGLSSGHYLWFRGRSESNLTTTMVIPRPRRYCLRFWYYEDGQNQYNLRVTMILDNRRWVTLNTFTSTIEHRQWKAILVTIPFYTQVFSKHFDLEITYTPSTKQYFSIFALDDIELLEGVCQDYQIGHTYTFTSNLEGLSLMPVVGDVGGVYKIGSNPAINKNVPAIDHTTLSTNGGYFLFYKNKKMPATTTLAVINVPADVNQRSSCIRFAYQLYEDTQFFVATRPANSQSAALRDLNKIWSPLFPKTHWTMGEANIQLAFEHQVVFYMRKTGLSNSSLVALDDVEVLENYKCQTMPNCDFEGGRFCSYTPYLRYEANVPEAGNRFNFGIFTGPIDDTTWPGPVYDHTTNQKSGSYLYLTAYRSAGLFTGLRSSVISGPKAVVPDVNYCLTFWYQMTSTDLGLTVSVHRFSATMHEQSRIVPLTTIAPQHAVTRWTAISISLNHSVLAGSREIQVQFEGQIVEARSIGVIAIDDIVVDERAICRPIDDEHFICENGVRINQTQVCDFIADCPSGLDEVDCGGCNFENGDRGGWTNAAKASYRSPFVLAQAANESQANPNAPKVDADGKATGHYMILYSSIAKYAGQLLLDGGQPAQRPKQAAPSCVMQFEYYLSKFGELNDIITVGMGTFVGDMNTFFRLVPEENRKLGVWRKARAYIGEMWQPFFVDIRSTLRGVGGVFAIDNIQFLKCAQPKPLKAGESCPAGQDVHLCPATRRCIGADQVCDFRNDCGDGYDESLCSSGALSCNGNSLERCRLTLAAPHNNFNWMSVEPALVNFLFYSPPVDNTQQSQYGHYLLMGQRLHRQESLPQEATFYTRTVASKRPNDACTVRFFYYTNGPEVNITRLHFYVHPKPLNGPMLTTPLFQATGDSEQRWKKGVARYTSTSPFQFAFRGVQSAWAPSLAIDDISFDLKKCILIDNVASSSSTTPRTTSASSGRVPTTPTTPGGPTSTSSPETRPSGHHKKPPVALAIVLPLLLVLGSVGGFFAWRRYQRRSALNANERLTLRMSTVEQSLRR